MASPDPPSGDAEETIDAPIASGAPARLPVGRLDLPVYRPRTHARFGRRLWLAVLAGAILAFVVVLFVLA